MSNKSSIVPDAWDDNWEAAVDHDAQTPESQSDAKVPARVTKAQRRAQHAEFNRQLWAEAEAENTYHFLETRTAAIPVKSEYKAPVTVLSRKPQIARRPTSSSTSILNSAVAGLSLNDANAEYDDDDDEFEKKPPQLTLEERQAIAQREREEKRRKYDEVRERLFGTSSATESGASSPGTTTPPVSQGQDQNQRQERNTRWRGRNRQNNGRGDSIRDNRRGSPASTVAGNHKKLYDPVYSAKPNSNYAQKKDKQPQSNNTNTNSNNSQSDGAEDFQRAQAPIRTPRGPDGSGRDGFGFGRGAGRGRG